MFIIDLSEIEKLYIYINIKNILYDRKFGNLPL